MSSFIDHGTDKADSTPLTAQMPPDTSALTRVRTPFIIDIEASGFGSRGYPIEVGVILNDEEKFCTLIQPAFDWTFWDDHAEEMHGISRQSLDIYGSPVVQVAAQLNKMVGGMTLYTDGWVVDKPWLIKLFHAARTPMHFFISPLEIILSEAQMGCWHAVKDEVIREMDIVRHRASVDAWVIQETYKRTLLMTGK